MYRASPRGRAFARLVASSRSVLRPPRRRASTSAQDEAPKSKSYQDTLLLPKPPIPQRFDAHEQAVRYGPRTTEELYRWQWEARRGSELFVLHDGPPYANGSLHNGHAVNKILKDVINRFQVLIGKRVHYMPGWDCHGLPIENKVLKSLKAAPNTLPPNEVRAASRQLASEQIAIQRGEFKKMHIMTDWSEDHTYRTYDEEYEIRQLKLFRDMVNNALITRRFRPIWWSPASRTALAEGELEYNDAHKSKSVYVKYPVLRADMSEPLAQVAGKHGLSELSLLVWTTTPWTLPANMAVAINSEIDYVVASNGKSTFVVAKEALIALPKSLGELEVLDTMPGSDLLGTRYRHFFQSPSSLSNPIFAAPYVKSDSGTGLVHSAPGHGSEDYSALQAIGLLKERDILSPVDGEGRYTSDILKLVPDEATGDRLLGKQVQDEGNDEVLQLLRDAGASVAVKTIKHKYPYDWKTKTPVITRATSQWFANIDGVKEKALRALSSVVFYPEGARARLESFVRERSEWCISRQRTWGVPIPALHDVGTDEAYLTVESLDHIIGVLSEKGVDYWWDGPVEEFIPPSLKGKTLRKSTDTMDVWFDSGTSWSLLRNLHGEVQQSGAARADVCLEGSDQHRGWFQSLLLTKFMSASEGDTPNPAALAPYKALITHGFVMDEQGRKMSKSDGNVISPITTIEGGENLKREPAYGADVLRLWAATSNYSSDMSMGPVILKQASEALRKLRNTARFMLGVIGTSKNDDPVKSSDYGLLDRYMLGELSLLEKKCREYYQDYQFHRVVHALNDFSTVQLSALYFDVTKDCLYADPIDNIQRRCIVATCKEILRVYKTLLAPIAPLLAEEIHEAWNPTNTPSIFMEPWQGTSMEGDAQIRGQMDILLQVRRTVLQLLESARNDKKLRSSLEAVVYIRHDPVEVTLGNPFRPTPPPALTTLLQHEDLLKTLFITSDARVGSSEVEGGHPWVYDKIIALDTQEQKEDVMSKHTTVLTVYIMPSPLKKCPRCWTYRRKPELELCDRCTDTVGHTHAHQ
ncbi:isoleucyl-tRNA synthetase [Calocera cornea HHB12733]|uniref:isoleucine--tRNA ligase n=1 Tax=Calocera cornea HHB12733 TaxID=1353952 RepID=A0A165END9_9BASI|nr:isoleucyl-tRNA synthetase [Calocera cornea HHB12733]